MTTHPIGPQSAASPSQSYPGSPSTCNRAYLLAGLRASLIVLALLVFLAVIVLL
jgi:hypothetical protein